MPLLDKRPSPSLPTPMLLEHPRTSLRLLLFPLQPSLLPQHLMLPSPLHLSQLALLPSEPTPESPLRLPTLSHKSMCRTTMSMSLLLSPPLLLLSTLPLLLSVMLAMLLPPLLSAMLDMLVMPLLLPLLLPKQNPCTCY